jgi:RNA polymerase sigma-70 factor (ECF subfamily)
MPVHPGPLAGCAPVLEPPSRAAPSEPDREEVALLTAVGRGDRDRALPELYRRYQRRLFGLGIRLLGDAGLAEELVQETLLRVWRTADRFDPSRGTVAAFVFTIARRLAIDLWRRPSSRPVRPAKETAAALDETIDQLLLQLTVRDALDSLPPAHRQVLELSYHADLTQVEVASRLGVPLGTVKSRAYHALRAFRRAVGERGIDA